MHQLGKMLLVFGLASALIGVVLIVGERLGLGRLPGDLVWKRKHVTVYLPWVTSLVVSVLMSLLLNWFLRRK
jgi:phosphate/sulfate permease